MNDDRSPSERLVTVSGAAQLLGISPEAVRARLTRGTLQREKGDDGTTYVRLNDDRTRTNDDRTADQTRTNGDRTDPTPDTFQLMQDQIDFLRRELERKDTIIMSLIQRVPELEPALEPRESPVTASEGEDKVEAPPEQEELRLSWWRRLFQG